MEDDTMDMVQPKDDMAEAGRGTDTQLAHLSLGEIVIPRAFLDDPQVMQALQQIFEAGGADINEFTVGHAANKINPETGYPEFFFKKFKRFLGAALPIAASFIPGIGPFAAAGLGAAGGLLGGGGLKSALLGGLTSGVGAGLAGGSTGALKGTLLGRLENSISGALSPIGSAVRSGLSSLGDGVSNAFEGIGNATGLGDVYNSASGALSDFGSSISDQVGKAYDGSVLQDAFRSGSDALNSIGINTGSDSLSAGVGANAGGGASSYSGSTLPWLSGNPSNIPQSSGIVTAKDAALPWLTNQPAGATQVANSNYASPIASALLGSYTNSKAEDQLLKQQRENAALFAPYLNFRFNPEDLTQDPGYQFNLAQGNKALDRAQLARGNFFSGQALKEAQDYGQGLADNTFNTAFNRALQTNAAGLQGAGAMAGVNDNIGNIRAASTVNSGNLYSGALGNILGGDSFTNTGALQGGNSDYLSNLLRQLALQWQYGAVA